MQSSAQCLEGSELTVGDTTILFFTEDQLMGSQSVGDKDWIMPCGHNCCTCDSECK